MKASFNSSRCEEVRESSDHAAGALNPTHIISKNEQKIYFEFEKFFTRIILCRH